MRIYTRVREFLPFVLPFVLEDRVGCLAHKLTSSGFDGVPDRLAFAEAITLKSL